MAGMTKLGKYLIRRELGKGAMGVVYEGFDPVIERTVAIKTILPSQLSSGEMPDVMQRFKREAQAAGRLNHPGIVAVYDYGEVVAEDDHTMVAAPAVVAGQADAGQRVAFIAMEYVKGRELKDFFEANERFPLKEVERIMVEMLDALDHAHSKGVTHRDMKPANLILLADGKVKVADFGIARIETSELTQAGTVMGTPSYMSPEQFMGQTVDGRSDLFSCGVILYQFLTGEKPFTGTTTTIMYKVLREEPLPPSTLNLGLPPAWDAVVNKAIAKNPADRFQTAREFSAAIKAAVASQGNAVRPAASTDETVVNMNRPALAPQPAPRQPERSAPPIPTAASPARPTPARAPMVEPAMAAQSAKPMPTGMLVGGGLGLLVVGAAVAFFVGGKGGGSANPPALNPTAAVSPAPTTPSAATAAAPAPAPVAPVTPPVAMASAEPAPEPGTMIISALGLVDPKDPKFKGDANAAQNEARADASRQLIDKALALYIDRGSLNKNYGVIEQKLLSQSGSFIKSVIHEGAPTSGKDGLIETETRAVVKMRDVQRSLNQLSKEERIDFIRNNGDPKVSITMAIANADTAQALPPARSVLAENVLKERIKTFGFRVWSVEGETATGPKAQVADFAIQGQAKLKQLSMKLQASGLTVTKTILTSWTIKAIDKSNGEEIYLNTVLPKGQSWASEEQALMDIGKSMGDEFSKNFFLQHFNFGTKRTNLNINGLPDKQTASMLLRELRGMRQVLDVQMLADTGKFQLQLAEGNASTILQETVFKPLNAKLGMACFAMAGSSGADVTVTFAAACAELAVRAKFESAPPAGLLDAPDSRSKSLLRASKTA